MGVKHGNLADAQVEKSGSPPAILGVILPELPLNLYTACEWCWYYYVAAPTWLSTCIPVAFISKKTSSSGMLKFIFYIILAINTITFVWFLMHNLLLIHLLKVVNLEYLMSWEWHCFLIWICDPVRHKRYILSTLKKMRVLHLQKI